MGDLRHVILFNGAASTEVCHHCHCTFELPLGYQAVAQLGMSPAKATLPTCRPCVQQREPELIEMLELFESYARFESGNDSTLHESDPQKGRK